MISNKIRFLATLVFIALLSGCISLPKVDSPTFEYKRHYVSDIGRKKVTVTVELDAFNPNNFGIENIHFGYQVKLKNRKLFAGMKKDIDLAPNQTSKVKVPVVIYYKDLQRNAEKVLTNILLDTRSIEATIEMQIANAAITSDSGWTVTVPIRYKKSVTQDIPLPKRDDVAKNIKKEVGKLKDKLKALF